jgi:Kdo2-lipid IVA lauroyltransferase/acyltransferase
MQSFRSRLYRRMSLIFGRLWSWTPWLWNRYFAAVLAFLWVDVLRIRRRLILQNISRVFPHMPERDKVIMMRRSMRFLCRSIFEIPRIPFLTSAEMDQLCVFEGCDSIKQDSGLLFMSLHLGCGDLGAAIFSEKVKPLSLISKRFKNHFLDTFWFTLRGQSKTEFIDAHGSRNAFEILKALRRGRGVVFVIDQFMGRPYGVEVPFFGIPTGTAYGLALFAQKTRAPLQPLYTYWGPEGRLHIVAGPAVAYEHLLGTDIEKNNVILSELFNHILEDIILQHPEQWMWVHNRWKVF